ncbi:MAG: hypothetical protein RIT27_935 [Pseudomonadota bacterium]|jgi:methyl-accepting chemotaxis protein
MISREILLEIYQAADKVETEMDNFNQMGVKIAHKTQIVIRTVITILLCVVVLNFFMLYGFMDEMRKVVVNMVDMYTRFATMSQDMHQMTGAVVNMEQNVRGIPTISNSMTNMNTQVSGMKNNVNTMTYKIVGIDQNMTIINSGVFDMANRFDHLSYTVHNMGYNVNQMSGPIRSMPFFP